MKTLLLIALCFSVISATAQDDAKSLMKDANKLFNSGDYKDAVEIYNKVLDLD